MEPETELQSLEKPIRKYLRSNPTDGELQKAVAVLGRLREEYELLPREEALSLREEAQKLKEAPLQYAIYLGPGPTNQRDVLVGLGQALFEAHLADDLPGHEQLSLGQQVLLNHDHNVVGVRNEYVRGETAEVINILRPPNSAEIIALLEDEGAAPRALVKWNEGSEIEVRLGVGLAQVKLARGDIIEIDPETMEAKTKVRPRLHVRAGGSEGTVVEISDKLFGESVRLGDLVRIESGLKFAFEKLPSLETRELTLEEVPDISYSDIGGLDAQIETFRDAIELPYLQRSKFERYRLSRPKGILLYGPPGCGKTMVAKAVANSLTESIKAHLSSLEQRIKLYIKLKADPTNADALAEIRAQLGMDADGPSSQPESLMARLERALRIHDVDLVRPEEKLREIRGLIGKEEVRSYFLNVKGPELLDKYVGETEHRIRSIFEEARRHASYYTPVVIFFDEMEAMFRARGTGRSSDIETTIVPQFLSEIDGFESSANVILIGATNRDDMIDPAILRPGRLDVKIKIDRPLKEAATDIFSFYLLPTLPLQKCAQDTRQESLGSIVFRSAYTKTSEVGQFDGDLLPPGFDLRLALSFSGEERAKLNELAPTLSVAQALYKREDPSFLPLWIKLKRLKGSVLLGAITQKLEVLHQGYSSDVNLKQLIDHLVEMEWIAEAMIQDAVSLLYSPGSLLKVLAKSGNHYTFPLSDFVTGAVIANIVSRTKKRAIKRELLEVGRTAEGITSDDLRAAIEEEFSESQEQLALYKLRDEMDLVNELIQSVDLHLETGKTDPWSEEKPRAYKVA